MKVEFLVNTEINDGRQLFISATDSFKAKTTKKSSIVLLCHSAFIFILWCG